MFLIRRPLGWKFVNPRGWGVASLCVLGEYVAFWTIILVVFYFNNQGL